MDFNKPLKITDDESLFMVACNSKKSATPVTE